MRPSTSVRVAKNQKRVLSDANALVTRFDYQLSARSGGWCVVKRPQLFDTPHRQSPATLDNEETLQA